MVLISSRSLGGSGTFSAVSSFSIPCPTNYSFLVPFTFSVCSQFSICQLCLDSPPGTCSVEMASKQQASRLGSPGLFPFTVGAWSCTACCLVSEMVVSWMLFVFQFSLASEEIQICFPLVAGSRNHISLYRERLLKQ